MITLNKHEKDALSGRFVSTSIANFINNNTIDRITYKSSYLLWNTYIFSNSDRQKIVNIQNDMIERALSFQKRSGKQNTPMIIYWFPTEYKKQMPVSKRSLDVDEINSASTFHSPGNSFIAIYRIEEAPKVLFHELIHFFELDNILPYGDDLEYKTRYRLKVPCLLREAYCELMGLLLNVESISKKTGVDFNTLYSIEYAFSMFQKQKILDFYNISNQHDLNKMESNTNVLTYFILKSAILISIKNPLDFFKERELHGFKLHSESFLKDLIENGLTKLFREKILVEIPELKNTLRMTIIE